MSVENEILQQDAQTPESSAPEQTADSSNQNTDTSSESVAQAHDNTPFHKHPRWQEMMEKARAAEERNSQYQSQLEQYQRKMAELENRFQSFAAPKPEVNPFVSKLKEIDPKYGEWAETIESRATKAEQLEQELQQMRYERLVEKYESSVGRLHDEHKTPAEVRDLIKSQLDAEALSGRVSMKDLPSHYKQLSERYGKLIENVKRAERESYVKAKTTDAKAPVSQPKGAPAPARNNKGQFTGDRETDLANIAKRAIRIAKGEGDI